MASVLNQWIYLVTRARSPLVRVASFNAPLANHPDPSVLHTICQITTRTPSTTLSAPTIEIAPVVLSIILKGYARYTELSYQVLTHHQSVSISRESQCSRVGRACSHSCACWSIHQDTFLIDLVTGQRSHCNVLHAACKSFTYNEQQQENTLIHVEMLPRPCGQKQDAHRGTRAGRRSLENFLARCFI